MIRKLWYADAWSNLGKPIYWTEGDISEISRFAREHRRDLVIRIIEPLNPSPLDLVELCRIGVVRSG